MVGQDKAGVFSVAPGGLRLMTCGEDHKRRLGGNGEARHQLLDARYC
jgi:hypothetical protein